MNYIFSHTQNNSTICVARKLLEISPADEIQYIQTYENEIYTNLNPSRKREFISTRALLFSMLPNKNPHITYSPTGKPLLKNNNISISHSKQYVAIILNKQQHVAIDVEEFRAEIIKISPRFLNTTEQKNYTSIEEITTIWSAKEVLYKLFEASPNFAANYSISGSITDESGEIIGKVFTKKIDKTVKIQYFRTTNLCIAWANNYSKQLV